MHFIELTTNIIQTTKRKAKMRRKCDGESFGGSIKTLQEVARAQFLNEHGRTQTSASKKQRILAIYSHEFVAKFVAHCENVRNIKSYNFFQKNSPRNNLIFKDFQGPRVIFQVFQAWILTFCFSRTFQVFKDPYAPCTWVLRLVFHLL